MSPTVFRLVLLVSCAHAMVHVYELAFASVEQYIGDEFGVQEETTGRMGTAWRIPFGFGAMLAGWLADKFGSKPMLLVYLCGCATTAVIAWWAPTIGLLFGTMFLMGCFAAIYHPAGLAIISRETTPENRSAALGWHGILGSLGIAAAPFAAAMLLSIEGFAWRDYYLLLMVPGFVLAAALHFVLHEQRRTAPDGELGALDALGQPPLFSRPFVLLTAVGAMTGFIYAALMNFLARYLTEANMQPNWISAKEFGAFAAAIVLLCGVVGQGLAGRIAKPKRLHSLLTIILLANAPCLLWMALAEGSMRLWAACAMGLVHFMNQPVYNSLIAHYVPFQRRSLGYGFSNMMCFGIGALGPAYAGAIKTAGFEDPNFVNYGSLAVLAVAASVASLGVARHKAA